MVFFKGKTKFCAFFMQKRKEMTHEKQKTNKEGLGPSEVALWTTSPDP